MESFYKRLKAEIDGDPLSRGYAGMSDREVAKSLREISDRALPNEHVETEDLIAAVHHSAYPSTVRMQNLLSWITSRDVVKISAPNIRSALRTIFNGHAQTLSAIRALENGTQSRAQELKLGRVTEKHVHHARKI